MGVTISRAAERKSRPSRGPGPRGIVPGLRGGPGNRDREAGLLALSGVVVAFALVLTWLAVSRPLGDVPARLARGELLDLHTVTRPGDLLPLLAFLETPQERSFVADRI